MDLSIAFQPMLWQVLPLDSKKHDILDVIAGAAIGLGANLIFTTEYSQEHMELTYDYFDGNHLIGFSYKF